MKLSFSAQRRTIGIYLSRVARMGQTHLFGRFWTRSLSTPAVSATQKSTFIQLSQDPTSSNKHIKREVLSSRLGVKNLIRRFANLLRELSRPATDELEYLSPFDLLLQFHWRNTPKLPFDVPVQTSLENSARKR